MSSRKAITFDFEIRNRATGELQKIAINAKSVEEAYAKMVSAVEREVRKVEKSVKQIDFSTLTMAASQAMQSIKSGFDSLIAPARSFETAMATVNTMAGKNADGLRGLTDQVKSLGGEIPLAREELANGLYQVISNGVPEDSWIGYLEQSAKAAVGGVADLGQTITVTSTLIKNYGADWAEAGHIQDLIQTTAKNGVTSFSQLGAALPRVSTNAAQLGVSIEELMAVFATTTGVTGNTSEVSTQLAAVLNSLVKPSSEATKAAAAMGIGFDAASIKAAGGFQNFLVQLDAAVQSYSAKTGTLSQTIYGQLFGSAEALRLLGSLTGEQKDVFTQNIAAMTESAGTIDTAFAEMASTGDAVAQMAQNQRQSWTDWIANIAGAMAPTVNFTSSLGMTAISFMQISRVCGEAAKTIKLFCAAENLRIRIAKITTAVTKAWKIAQTALNFSLSANPIGVIVMAVAGLVAAFRIAYVHCESFHNIVDKIWDAMKKFGAAVLDVAKWLWDKLVVAFKKLCEWGQVVWYYFKKIFGITDNSTAPAANAAAAAVGDIGEQAEDAADAVDDLTDLLKNLDKDKDKDKKKGTQYTAGQKRGRDLSVDVYDLTTIEQYTARIDKLRKMQETANAKQYAELQRQIEQVERIKEGFENAYKVMERPAQMQNIWQIVSASSEAKKSVEKIVKDTGISFAEAAKGIANKTGETFAQVLRDAAPAVRRYADMVGKEVNTALGFKFDSKRPDNLQPTQGARKLAKKNEESRKSQKFDMGTLQGGWGGIKSGVDAVQSLTDALKGNADAWTVLKTVIDSVFQIFQAVTSVIQMVTMFSNLLSGAKNAEIAPTVASTAATEADTKAKEANAAAGFFAAHAYIPFVGAEIAAGYVGLMKGVVAGVRAFADGGIAYGPTLGLFGEYPGASSNPEVVAPLSDLKNLLGTGDTGARGGVVEFRIKGRNLEGVLQKRNKLTSRT